MTIVSVHACYWDSVKNLAFILSASQNQNIGDLLPIAEDQVTT
jgi:hypothetical protein